MRLHVPVGKLERGAGDPVREACRVVDARSRAGGVRACRRVVGGASGGTRRSTRRHRDDTDNACRAVITQAAVACAPIFAVASVAALRIIGPLAELHWERRWRLRRRSADTQHQQQTNGEQLRPGEQHLRAARLKMRGCDRCSTSHALFAKG
jgi:hypothetical protein